MVRGRDFRAVNVAKVVRANHDATFGASWAVHKEAAQRAYLLRQPIPKHIGPVAPAWLKAIERIPSSELVTRPIPVQHQPLNTKSRKPKKIFKPQKIVYEEDELRRTFYRDHPWELARPRVILEIDGKDSWYCDWSKGLQQPGIPLSGECVVQRQLWLMHNTQTVLDPENPGQQITKGPLAKQEAYDQARREFYALRQEEEVERRIQREEATMVGAYFGKSRLQVGDQLENRHFERWKAWAAEENAAIEHQRASAYTSYGATATDGEVDTADIEAEIDAPA